MEETGVSMGEDPQNGDKAPKAYGRLGNSSKGCTLVHLFVKLTMYFITTKMFESEPKGRSEFCGGMIVIKFWEKKISITIKGKLATAFATAVVVAIGVFCCIVR